jgi:ABC-type polar amino acid transport system ATPase subunit
VTDAVAFVADGRVIAQGPAAAFFDHPPEPRVRAFLERSLAP